MIKLSKMQGRPIWATTLKVILRIVTVLILVVVIPLVILNVTCMFEQDSQVPGFLGYSMLDVISGSMTGTIDVGDVVIINHSVKNIAVRRYCYLYR